MTGGQGLKVFDSAGEVAAAAAGVFADLAAAGVEARGVFTVALSGGSTPRAMYEALTGPDFEGRVPWRGVHLFWGDERCVAPDDPESNYAMARDALISGVAIPEENVHRIRGEDPPAEAARQYEAELTGFFSSFALPFSDLDPGVPVLDLVLLGLGADGHTLSLFPGTTALAETERLVVENHVERLGAWRLTMTLRLVNRARSAVFLVSGREKAEALKRAFNGNGGDGGGKGCPAALIKPSSSGEGGRRGGGGVGEDGPLWLVDRAAAGLL